MTNINRIKDIQLALSNAKNKRKGKPAMLSDEEWSLVLEKHNQGISASSLYDALVLTVKPFFTHKESFCNALWRNKGKQAKHE